MKRISSWNLILDFVVMTSLAMATLRANAAETPAADVLAYYQPTPDSINWNTAVVSGTVFTRGASGTVGPFGRPCAILEGSPTKKGEVVTRSVFVLDAGNGTTGSVQLDVFVRTDTYSSSDGSVDVAVTYTLENAVVLPLQSVAGAQCFMAADSNKVFASTNQNVVAAVVNKKSLAISVTNPQGFEAPISAITATPSGDVFVTLGSGLDTEWLYYNERSEGWIVEGQNYGAPNGFAVLANPVNAATF